MQAFLKTKKCRLSLTIFFFVCTFCRTIQRSLHQILVPPLKPQKQPTLSPHQNHQRPPPKPPLKRQNHLRQAAETAIFYQFPEFFSVFCFDTNILTVSFPAGGSCHNSPSTDRVTLARGQSHDPWHEVGPHTQVVRSGSGGWEMRGCRVARLVL